MRLQKTRVLEFRGDRAWAFWFRPRIRAALIQGCQEHFSDRKCPIGKWPNFNLPFGTSAVKLDTHDLDRSLIEPAAGLFRSLFLFFSSAPAAGLRAATGLTAVYKSS